MQEQSYDIPNQVDFFNYSRRLSSVVQVGNTPLGGEYPIRVQSMANVSTMDTEAAIRQAGRMIAAGAEYVRFTAQGEREARNLGNIRKGLDESGFQTPLVADIHFNPRAADIAAEEVEKVRINPGNYVDKVKTFSHQEYTKEEYAAELQKIRNRFIPFLEICRRHHTAVRIGVNHGSLSDRIMSRYGDTPEGMVASCMEFLRICREENFSDVVISMKASNTVVMVQSVRLLVQTMDTENMHYPLHLGVTEAGDGEDGRIKSAVGIGALLADGIGDTVRVSLSEDPEAEVPVAQKLVSYIGMRRQEPAIKAEVAPGFNPVYPQRRTTRRVDIIGGGQVPVVLSDRSSGDYVSDPGSQPDYLYIGKEDPENLPGQFRLIVDAAYWKESPNAFPLFRSSEINLMEECSSSVKFIRLSYEDLTDSTVETLKTEKAAVVLLTPATRNIIGETRAFMHRLLAARCDVPVILFRTYDEKDKETFQIQAGVDYGTLFLDGFLEGVLLTNKEMEARLTDYYTFAILQAVRMRISKTEFISCPSCGRTLFNLQKTVARVKEATSHLKGLKIGIMGCIVNGIGEMADADYGYVGAGRGRVSLYKGKKCVLRNIPEEEAVDRLVQLIKDQGDWQD